MRPARTAAIALLLLAPHAPSWAGESGPGASPPSLDGVPRQAIPDPPAARRETLDSLLLKLKHAEGPTEARPIEAAILGVLSQSRSPSTDLVMDHASTLLREGDAEAALALYRAVTELAPDFAAAWRQRGMVEAMFGQSGAAAADLRHAITLQPSDFAALASLGRVLENSGDKSGAVEAYGRALALDPNVGDVAIRVRQLESEIDGSPI